MVVERDSGRILHRSFRDLANLVEPGDSLVINTTRVLRARLLGRRESGAPAEILLLREREPDVWEAMVNPGGKIRPGRRITIAPDLSVEILSITDRRTRLVRLESRGIPTRDAIERHGHVPLPPYIARADELADAERYQTVYARESGSAAAPTAGLHFTPELLAALEQRGVRRVEILLHVGAGTFKPVEMDDPAGHVMHEEQFVISKRAAQMLNEARAGRRSIWAVGTTSVRTLESAYREVEGFVAGAGETRIFIRPPHRPRAVDKVITNFHLPRSTLIMLVAATAGYELTMRAYAEAVAERYRFFSYGDAMAIV